MKVSCFAVLTVSLFLFSGCIKDPTINFLDACKKAEDATNKGQYVIADKLWEDIALEYPDDWKVFYNWATTLIKWGDVGGEDAISHYQEACIQFEKAVTLNALSDEVFYNWGNAYAKIAEISPQDEENYRQACEKYSKATEINPEKDQAFYNWGTVLFNWAKLEGADSQGKCIAACDKFQKATAINPDKYEAFNNWGLTLVYQSKIENDSKLRLLQQAETAFLKSEAIKKCHSAYNLACVYALSDDEVKCREWLEFAEKNDCLESHKHAMQDKDLASMQDKEWFKNLKWKDDK